MSSSLNTSFAFRERHLLELIRLLGLLQLSIGVLRNVAELLFDVHLNFFMVLVDVKNFTLGVVRVPVQLADEELGQVIAADVDGLDCVRDRVALEDGNSVGAAVARVEDRAGRSPGGE